MAEQPIPKGMSAISARSRRMRTPLVTANRSVRRTLGRLRSTKRSDAVEQPTPEPQSVGAEVEPVGAGQPDATAPARRLFFKHWRLILAVIIVLIQGLLAWLGWRLRERRRERHLEG